jgi:predicted signal transduction protein with EAL and GGDEF domain
MSKQAKKVTLDGLADKVDKLAATMEAGFKRMDKGFNDAKEDNESLARMVANGFEQTAKDMAKLEQGQENIQLRVDSLAPQFEVRGLERRVKRLEDRAGIRHTIQSQ